WSCCHCINDVLCFVDRFIFFFQAEDGIRDATVTGVQTCALPIFLKKKCAKWSARHSRLSARKPRRPLPPSLRRLPRHLRLLSQRSEERRVGKECSYRRGRNRGEKTESQ